MPEGPPASSPALLGFIPGSFERHPPPTYLTPLLFPSVQEPSVTSALAAEMNDSIQSRGS